MRQGEAEIKKESQKESLSENTSRIIRNEIISIFLYLYTKYKVVSVLVGVRSKLYFSYFEAPFFEKHLEFSCQILQDILI